MQSINRTSLLPVSSCTTTAVLIDNKDAGEWYGWWILPLTRHKDLKPKTLDEMYAGRLRAAGLNVNAIKRGVEERMYNGSPFPVRYATEDEMVQVLSMLALGVGKAIEI